MNKLQTTVIEILEEIFKFGWTISLITVTDKGHDNCHGDFIEMGSFLYYPYNKVVRPYRNSWTKNDLKKVPNALRIIINNDKEQRLMRKYQEIFDIENKD